MRMIILSALFALGLGIAGAPSASATPMSGLSNAVTANSLVEEAQYRDRRRYRRPRHYRRPRCRNVRVCDRTVFGRVCRYERVCRGGRYR
ncbi:MAG: hypothetical protein K9G60_03545 [Pseudolabrys sp.]|nr:hypothetical protein [Pseudolabrys sp.]